MVTQFVRAKLEKRLVNAFSLRLYTLHLAVTQVLSIPAGANIENGALGVETARDFARGRVAPES